MIYHGRKERNKLAKNWKDVTFCSWKFDFVGSSKIEFKIYDKKGKRKRKKVKEKEGKNKGVEKVQWEWLKANSS